LKGLQSPWSRAKVSCVVVSGDALQRWWQTLSDDERSRLLQPGVIDSALAADVGELVARIGFHLGATFDGGEPMQFAPEAMRDFVRAKAAEGHGPLGPSFGR
jgi:hypothetical protein